MNIAKTTRFLFSRLMPGIVEAGGGGVVADEVEAVEEEIPAEEDAPDADDARNDGGNDEAEASAEPAAEPESGEIVVTIGDEQPQQTDEEEAKAPAWVKELRKQNRELARAMRQKDAEIATLKGGGSAKPAAIDVGPEPTMEGCDFDAEVYARDLKAWMGRKAQADSQAAEERKQQEAAQSAWQGRLETYGKAKAALKVPDIEDAEAAVQDVLSVVQQGVILNGADNPALMVYAIGKNPAKAKELAAITDPVKFAFAVAKLETKLKVTPKKTAPPPERVVSSAVPGASGAPADLKRLEDEARRTGDYTKVFDFKRRHKARQAA